MWGPFWYFKIVLFSCAFYPYFLFRFTGTIVGVGDISSQWSDSRWRSLKVKMFLSSAGVLIYLLSPR